MVHQLIFRVMATQALFAIFVQYDANLDGRVRGDEAKQLLKAGGHGGDDIGKGSRNIIFNMSLI